MTQERIYQQAPKPRRAPQAEYEAPFPVPTDPIDELLQAADVILETIDEVTE